MTTAIPPGVRPQDPARVKKLERAVTNGLPLRDARLAECREAVDAEFNRYWRLSARADQCRGTDQAERLDRIAYDIDLLACDMEVTLGLLEEAPDAFWMVCGQQDADSLLKLPPRAIEEFDAPEHRLETYDADRCEEEAERV